MGEETLTKTVGYKTGTEIEDREGDEIKKWYNEQQEAEGHEEEESRQSKWFEAAVHL